MAERKNVSRELEYELKFTPPLYKQRYAAVVDLARKHCPHKVGFTNTSGKVWSTTGVLSLVMWLVLLHNRSRIFLIGNFA